jgi:hypothetical protein
MRVGEKLCTWVVDVQEGIIRARTADRKPGKENKAQDGCLEGAALVP